MLLVNISLLLLKYISRCCFDAFIFLHKSLSEYLVMLFDVLDFQICTCRRLSLGRCSSILRALHWVVGPVCHYCVYFDSNFVCCCNHCISQCQTGHSFFKNFPENKASKRYINVKISLLIKFFIRFIKSLVASMGFNFLFPFEQTFTALFCCSNWPAIEAFVITIKTKYIQLSLKQNSCLSRFCVLPVV